MESLGKLLLLTVPLALLMAASCNSAPQLSVLPPSLRLGRLLEQAVEDAEDEDDYDDLEVPDSQFPSMPVSFATLTADEAVIRGGCAAGLVRCASACCMLLLPRRTGRCPPPLRRVGVGLCL